MVLPRVLPFAVAAVAVSITFALPAHATDPPAAARITGEPGGENDTFGWAVSSFGDVNGDDIPDLFVGAPTNDAVAGFAGRAYLFLGPVLTNRTAASANAKITAQAFGDNLGVSLCNSGDVNNDGFDDLLIGARGHDVPGIQSGRVYLFNGPVSGSFSATQANATITGIDFEELGWSVHSGGDLDNDGFADLALGAHQFGDTETFSVGRVYVFSGPVTGAQAAATADGIITGEFVNDMLGTSVAIVGDVNGDGFDDLAAGAPHGPIVFLDPGRAYVFFGPVTGSVSAATADVILTGEADNDLFGTSVAPAGDVNGDGLADFLVGAEQTFNNGPGKAYLFLGPLQESASAATAAATFIGEVSKDSFGHSVSTAGDVNNDELDDVLIGAWDNGAGGARAGRAYLFLSPLHGTIPAAQADLILTGSESGDEFGIAVGCAGDQDGNGRDDLLIGAAQFNEGDPGLAHVFLGESFATGVTLFDTPGGVRISPAFPNPARSSAAFSLHLDREESLRMSVVDPSGRRLRVYPPRQLGAGEHQLEWDGRDESGRHVASGVYFVRLDVGSDLAARKVTFVRE
jgi:hypothetical protein